ncbi:hypothetical protein EPI10_021274 [Gossypium australe]|uniref:Uncharacterized protein n=1 Tax=Gossypium australe TaxID=47621 RepID=A0A5B6WIG0_9ROSI|nr:hypothetical protein EPI10_021274 [Gossypium australe]
MDRATEGLRQCDRVSPWQGEYGSICPNDGGILAELQVRSTLSQEIKEKQNLDKELVKRIR